MSQHDFNIANQTFPSFRSDLNDALQASATMSAGSSAPTTPYAYQLWFDTTTDTWKVRNSGNTAWISTITTDLATGNVGIGTSSPSETLHVEESTTGNAVRVSKGGNYIVMGGSGSGTQYVKGYEGTVAFGNAFAGNTTFLTGDTERLRIDSSGQIIISGNAGSTTNSLDLSYNGGSGQANIQADSSGGNTFLTFGTSSSGSVSERMRIDSSGNVLVGGTSLGENGAVTMAGDGRIYAIRASDTAGFFGRTGADGSIVNFTKDGGTVGSIASEGGNSLIVQGGTTGGAGLHYHGNSFSIVPARNNARIDNVIDLGTGTHRFDDIYATNGTIQTSDANEKQQIAALTDAEMTAAKAISQLFKTFKWNDAVSEKSDAARTHAGVIAQDVQAAMTAAGLDAGDYAFFISNTWWETQTEVPAVEAVEAVYEDVVIPAVLDEDGNEVEAERTEQRTVTEAVEAVDAYTRTDTYDTAEEAPEGATERNRKGIRYPELLAFVGAATEQRLANIETRLAALEAD